MTLLQFSVKNDKRLDHTITRLRLSRKDHCLCFEPQTDITVLELAHFTELMIICSTLGMLPELQDIYLEKHNLLRHFIKEER